MKRLSLAVILIAALTGAVFYGTRRCAVVDQAKFEALHRAAAGLTATTTAGVNYPTFSAQVQSLATELLVAKGRGGSERERAMVEAYDSALHAYRDALASPLFDSYRGDNIHIPYDEAEKFQALDALIAKTGKVVDEQLRNSQADLKIAQDAFAAVKAELKRSGNIPQAELKAQEVRARGLRTKREAESQFQARQTSEEESAVSTVLASAAIKERLGAVIYESEVPRWQIWRATIVGWWQLVPDHAIAALPDQPTPIAQDQPDPNCVCSGDGVLINCPYPN